MRKNMKHERNMRDMTAKQVASAIGVHENAVLRWEKGTAEPMGSNLIELSKLYGCSPEYLLEQTDDPRGVAVTASK